jgi:hypothetical protein
MYVIYFQQIYLPHYVFYLTGFECYTSIVLYCPKRQLRCSNCSAKCLSKTLVVCSGSSVLHCRKHDKIIFCLYVFDYMFFVSYGQSLVNIRYLYVPYSFTPFFVRFVGQLHLCPMRGNDFIFNLFNFLLVSSKVWPSSCLLCLS